MKILIAEDDPIARRILEATLTKHGYEVVVACDGHDAWKALQEPEAPKLCILDWMMPGLDGLQVCREIRRKVEKTSYTYVLLLTVKGSKENIIEGLEAGADDYLIKPFDSYELRARLDVGKRILNLQNQFLFVCEELRQQAARDSMTGLWNHAAIMDCLEQELARAARQGSPLAILMADLDHFKGINDSHGHPTGDAVLREVARTLKALVRPYDGVGRYGGEEFLMVLPGCNGSSAMRLADRLRLEVSAMQIRHDGKLVPVTMSIGAASAEQAKGVDSAALLQQADLALYDAKHAGRNRVAYRQIGLTQAGGGAPPAPYESSKIRKPSPSEKTEPTAI